MAGRYANMSTATHGHSKRGRIPCMARYLNDSREFPSVNQAYVWLLERFIAKDPSFLARCGNSRLMRYFAKEPGDLFLSLKDPSEMASAFHKFANGWYAKVKLSLSERFANLESYAVLIGLRYPGDWDFDDFGRDRILRERRKSAQEFPLEPKDLAEEDEDEAFKVLEMIRARQRALRAKR